MFIGIELPGTKIVMNRLNVHQLLERISDTNKRNPWVMKFHLFMFFFALLVYYHNEVFKACLEYFWY